MGRGWPRSQNALPKLLMDPIRCPSRKQCSDGSHTSPHAPLGPKHAPLGWVLGRAAAASAAIIHGSTGRRSANIPRRRGTGHPHAIAANKKGRAKTLLLGPLGGHAPLDRRRGQVELVVQRLLDEVQQRPFDGAEDHLLEVCVAQQSM